MDRGLRVTRWDAVVFARAAIVAGLALTLAWLITAATDEGGVPWGERAGRTLPLTPVCAAVGAWGALAPVRARGEVRALEALGRSRVQIALAAIAGGAAVALAAAVVLGAIRAVDVAGFYPSAIHASAWRWESGAFVNRALGLVVDAAGSPARFAAPAEVRPLTGIPQGGRAAAAIATALAGVALPMLLAELLMARHAGPAEGERLGDAGVRASRWPAAAAAGAAIALSVMLFQAAAARLVPPICAALPPAALLAFAVRRYKASS
ncbi:MAG TPA: hypothetical protein VK762_13755 [Polyangiaceae bacterium]|jgi:hypothetical protein|nr:hypothetical protein [Polyangiaceae bacterium]